MCPNDDTDHRSEGADDSKGILGRLRAETLALAEDKGLTAEHVEVVSARPLTVDEAIGKPDRTDFPIQKGKEFLMEARFRDCRGQAFTSMPGEFEGTVGEILSKEPQTDFDRALLVATANAILNHLAIADHTVHCRDSGPKDCAAGVVEFVKQRFGAPRIGFIGFQPALITALVQEFPIRVTDMDPDNVGKDRLGVMVESTDQTRDVIDWADVVFATGTVVANDTIGDILCDKPLVFYGTTISGTAALLGYERYCPCGT